MLSKLFKCKHDYSIIALSNIAKMKDGKPCILVKQECEKCGERRKTWVPTTEDVFSDKDTTFISWIYLDDVLDYEKQ